MKIEPVSISAVADSVMLPLFLQGLSCGFPSPADDHLDNSLDLHERLVKRPSATYFAWANGDSLVEMGILDGDLLIVDRSLEVKQNDVVVASLNGELCCKVIDIRRRLLISANGSYPPIPIPEDMDLIIEGVVIHAVHILRDE